jgi:hypothetical protein
LQPSGIKIRRAAKAAGINKILTNDQAFNGNFALA